MSRPRAFLETSALEGDLVTVDGEGFHHLRRVLRLGPGDEVELFDGAGLLAGAVITAARGGALSLRVRERRRVEPPPPPRVSLLCGELKGDRMDLVIQKATELGVDRLVPVVTSRSAVRATGEAARRRHRRHLKVARQACRQCGRAHLPQVLGATPLVEALISRRGSRGYVLWESSRAAGLSLALEPARDAEEIRLLVGPEGGFSAEEISLALERGFEEVTMGPLVLRAETAAVAAVTLTAARLGRLG